MAKRGREPGPIYVAFSVSGMERERLEHLANVLGFPDPRALGADIFSIGLMMTLARYEPEPKRCRRELISKLRSELTGAAPPRRVK